MKIYIEKEDPYLRVKKILVIFIMAGLFTSGFGLGMIKIIQAKTEVLPVPSTASELATIQGNSFLAVSNPTDPVIPPKKIKVVITAYSSTLWETDNTPFITASGSEVKEGIVANNLLPFGTEIRIPELYGDKVFVVEDRMNWKKGYYHIDIWFPEHQQAKDFGATTTYIEVLKN
ncbi:MAG: hypothetical protein COT32_00490 [Candidatus Nealsonbacteria bacterium CG08_land_8_20_14_0_20_36_22]|uniref:3D domain-containing protein n=1 Tax=Candidatus Nealsonbacteria bacterium CG08_land_8_20_14_0_20_36_22 TaxID=1974704 RepID=A0A2H0YRE2_9BACT|nr:MAG: hypothetical protein COT32_00490 [Candidatus Nealsonbacteria bacterium CG08_land_8_20_14_0_20_36_22]